ncbi:MAG: hypothetical protein H0X54_00670 [Propionibacteriales bacterium]|nr:hypothetical protein [Propionibacteriales bacterium]
MFVSSKLAVGLAAVIAAAGAFTAGSLVDDAQLPDIGDPIVMTRDVDATADASTGKEATAEQTRSAADGGDGDREPARVDDALRASDDDSPSGGDDGRRDDDSGVDDDGSDDVDVVYPTPEPVDDEADDNDDDDEDDEDYDDDDDGDDDDDDGAGDD